MGLVHSSGGLESSLALMHRCLESLWFGTLQSYAVFKAFPSALRTINSSQLVSFCSLSYRTLTNPFPHGHHPSCHVPQALFNAAAGRNCLKQSSARPPTHTAGLLLPTWLTYPTFLLSRRG